MTDSLTAALAATLRTARTERGLSVSALARSSGVSRAMIAKVESGDAQPTAVLLGRLSGALGLSLSQLLARAEGEPSRLSRAAEQARWIDPATGYLRRAVSPSAGGPLELVDVVLPVGVDIAFPAEAYVLSHQQLWVLAGWLRFVEGDGTPAETIHELRGGDCLQLGPAQPCRFVNAGNEPCRYLVALARR